MRSPLTLVASFILAAHAAAQLPASKAEPVPVELALASLREVHTGVIAEEMHVRFRSGAGGERTDTIALRMESNADAVQRLRLELGPLRIYAASGTITAVHASAPGRCYTRSYTGALTPQVLAGVLPPIPLPQFALVADRGGAFRAPTPHTADISWSDAVLDDTVRPPTVTLTGAGAKSRVTLIANAETSRLIRFTASIQGPDGDSTLELMNFRPVDPGDPATWAIPTEGLEQVATLAALRPPAPPPAAEILPGQPVPDLSFSRPDLSRWSLHSALLDAAANQAAAGAAAPPAVVIFFRFSAIPERAAEIIRDAKAGLAALRQVTIGRALPGDNPAEIGPLPAVTASAIVMELGEFTPQRWEEARSAWGLISRERRPRNPLDIPADALMWAPSAAQTIERFAHGANAIVVVVAPDRTLKAVIRLDGRYADMVAVAKELRDLLTP